MANIDIKNVEFHKPNEEELKELKKNLSIHNRMVFFKRFMVLFIVLLVILVFQYFGQFSLVQDYSWGAFFARQWLFFTFFIVLNIISLIPLVYARLTVKDIKFHKFKVIKKVKVNESASSNTSTGLGGFIFAPNVKYKYLMLMDGEDNITGKAFVNGIFEYDTVKEGDVVYVERVPHKDDVIHYYVTTSYKDRK